MRFLRPFGALLVVACMGAVVFSTCFRIASGLRQAGAPHHDDELAWVCREFQLSDAETDRLRTLHNDYKPKCDEMCARIAAKNRDLAALLVSATNVSPAIERTLGEIATLRAECQGHMLRHFHEVARTLSDDRGARYLSEMHRLTLGVHSPENATIDHEFR